MDYYDIINDFDWTSVPKGSPLRYNTPQLFVKSYEIDKNLTINRLRNYVTVVTDKDTYKFYENLYSEVTTEPDTGKYYLFPFFENNIRNFQNTFGDTFQNAFGGSGVGGALDQGMQSYLGAYYDVKQTGFGAADAVGSFLNEKGINSIGDVFKSVGDNGNPGSYIETPKFYDFTSATEGALQVNFVLSNTIDAASIEKNYEFIKHLIEKNRPYRKDAISMTPPRIYEVTLKGWRYMRWAYCSSVSVSFLGARKMIGDKIVPEGYAISLAFTPLTIEPANFINFLSNASGKGFGGSIEQAGPPKQ